MRSYEKDVSLEARLCLFQKYRAPDPVTWLGVRITGELRINPDSQAVPRTLSRTPWGGTPGVHSFPSQQWSPKMLDPLP